MSRVMTCNRGCKMERFHEGPCSPLTPLDTLQRPCPGWCKRERPHYGPCMTYTLADVANQPSGARIFHYPLSADVRLAPLGELSRKGVGEDKHGR